MTDLKKEYDYPDEDQDDFNDSIHAYMESDEQSIDETRYQVINSLMGTCQVIGLQHIRQNRGADKALVEAANHLGKAQKLLGKELNQLKKQNKE